jgi:hypothetical protein
VQGRSSLRLLLLEVLAIILRTLVDRGLTERHLGVLIACVLAVGTRRTTLLHMMSMQGQDRGRVHAEEFDLVRQRPHRMFEVTDQ